MRKYTSILATSYACLKNWIVGNTGYCLYCLHKNNEPDRHIFNTDGCIARTPYLQPLHFPIYSVVHTKLEMGFLCSVTKGLSNDVCKIRSLYLQFYFDFLKLLWDYKLQENLLLTRQQSILTKFLSKWGFGKKWYIYQIFHFVGN